MDAEYIIPIWWENFLSLSVQWNVVNRKCYCNAHSQIMEITQIWEFLSKASHLFWLKRCHEIWMLYMSFCAWEGTYWILACKQLSRYALSVRACKPNSIHKEVVVHHPTHHFIIGWTSLFLTFAAVYLFLRTFENISPRSNSLHLTVIAKLLLYLGRTTLLMAYFHMLQF